jgi:DNA-binding response OmpR family regulator
MVKGRVVSLQDDEILNKLLSKEISSEEFEVYEVNNGREGLVVIREDSKPVLVILDPLVAEVDGFTVLEELKSSEKTKDIPVIIISILSGEEDIKRGLALGAEEYIVKSQHSMFEILERVRYHLGNKKQ